MKTEQILREAAIQESIVIANAQKEKGESNSAYKGKRAAFDSYAKYLKDECDKVEIPSAWDSCSTGYAVSING